MSSAQAERRGRRHGAQRRTPDGPARVLVIHDSLPLLDRGGADSRLMQILRALREDGHFVSYAARAAIENQEPYAAALCEAGIRGYVADTEGAGGVEAEAPHRWRLAEVLGREKFDTAILSHWFWSEMSVAEQYLEEVQCLSPETLTAVLTDDCHGLRERRAAELSGSAADWERSYDFEQRELEIYGRADVVLSISEVDRRRLLAAAPELQIELLPMVADLAEQWPGFADREGLLFLANFDNPANVDGIRWFLEGVWPRVRSGLPGISLCLAGNRAPMALALPDSGLLCAGHVPDLGSLLARYRVFVSPIRFGTGIRTKNLLALSHGVPLVATSVSAEGMNLTAGENALIADTPQEFAEAMLRAYSDAKLWRSLKNRGRAHLQREFSAARSKTQLRGILQRARQPRPQRAIGRGPLSFRRVEQAFPEVLRRPPSKQRTSLRLVGYLQLAEALLAEHHPAAAREQLRHIFALVPGALPETLFFKRVEKTLERCYRELGERIPYAKNGVSPL